MLWRPRRCEARLRRAIIDALKKNQEKLANEGFVVTSTIQKEMARIIKPDALK